MPYRKISLREGFTLVETMVAIGLFVTIAVSSIGLFFSAQSIVGQVYDYTRIDALNRLIADTVLADIRTSSILGVEYPLDTDPAQSRLVLMNAQGARIAYEFRADDMCTNIQGVCLIRSQDGKDAVIGEGVPISVRGSFTLSGLMQDPPEGKAYITMNLILTPDDGKVSDIKAVHSAHARYGL